MQVKEKQSREIVRAIQRLQELQLQQAFDPINPDSRPTQAQQDFLNDLADIELTPGSWIPKVQYRYLIGGNQSGKTQTGARELAWVMSDNHPTWTRPARWGDTPLLAIVAGQDRKMMEIEIWDKKIKPLLRSGEWTEKRVGGILNFAVNEKNGYKIVFVSHNDSSESNRQHMQGFVANFVWLDEMPRDIKILEELQRRVDSRKGYFIATFTPKSRNDAIRRVVDASIPPIGKKYRLSKLDNPLNAATREMEIQKLAGYSEAQKRTILYGEWAMGEEAVYNVNVDDIIVEQLPEHYSRTWRHVVSVDPALKSKFGFTIWAEDPTNGVWYLIDDRYIEGKEAANPDVTVDVTQKRLQGLNIVKRISDPEGTWFITQAQKYRINYIYPNKANRKAELIKGLQVALSSGKIRVGSWCSTFIDEIQSCQWSETSDRIINSSSYHTLDCAQYFVDLMPTYDESQRVRPWYEDLRIRNEERKIKEATQKSQLGGNRIRRSIGAWARR